MALWEGRRGCWGRALRLGGAKPWVLGGGCGCLASCSRAGGDLRRHPAPLPPSGLCRASPHAEASGAGKGPLVPLWVAGCCDRNTRRCAPPGQTQRGGGSAVVVGLEAAVFPHPAGWGG